VFAWEKDTKVCKKSCCLKQWGFWGGPESVSKQNLSGSEGKGEGSARAPVARVCLIPRQSKAFLALA